MKCSDHKLSRRNLLTIGAVGGIGLTLTDFFKIKSAHADQKHYESKEGTAKSVIFIFLPGGMAQQESFDPKPYAPLEYRGPMGSIATNVTGVRVNQLFKNTAKIADKISIIRSMTHGEAAHERGVHNMFTGYRPSPALKYPSMGSVVSHEFGPRNNLPPYVLIPNQTIPEQGTGYLSSSYAAFSLGADPNQKGFKVRDLQLPGGVDKNRYQKRRKLLDVVNGHFREKEKSDALDSLDTFYNRAYSLISSQKAREAFDIEKEDPKIRDEYGRNVAGSRMLMARRLVEAGVRFVTLIRDLDRRGLLDSTLVCLCSEFGRTPKINQTSGRDHWPKVFSSLMAGGGVKKGLVYGSSNSTASEPETDALSVEDWATTIYKCLGITADKELMAPGARPIEIVDGGKVRKELLA